MEENENEYETNMYLNIKCYDNYILISNIALERLVRKLTNARTDSYC